MVVLFVCFFICISNWFLISQALINNALLCCAGVQAHVVLLLTVPVWGLGHKTNRKRWGSSYSPVLPVPSILRGKVHTCLSVSSRMNNHPICQSPMGHSPWFKPHEKVFVYLYTTWELYLLLTVDFAGEVCLNTWPKSRGLYVAITIMLIAAVMLGVLLRLLFFLIFPAICCQSPRQKQPLELDLRLNLH